MRIILMGSSTFALPTLEALYRNYDIIAVYSRAAKPSGRGMKYIPTPVAQRANELSIPIYTPKNFKNSQDIMQFQSLNADFAIVAAYGLILPQEILQSPHYGCLNIHGSLLPRWRGAAPIHRAIMAGDPQTGVTIMNMSEGLDEGDIYQMRAIDLSEQDTTGKIHDQIAEMGADLLIDTIDQIMYQNLKPTPQDPLLATYADKITKQEAEIKYHQCLAIDALRKVNAMNPFPGAYIINNNMRYKIIEAQITEFSGPAGSISADFTINCLDRALRPIIIQKEGKQKQHIDDFLNGLQH